MNLKFVCTLIFCICMHNACEAKSVALGASHLSGSDENNYLLNNFEVLVAINEWTTPENTEIFSGEIESRIHAGSEGRSMMPRKKINLVHSGEKSDEEPPIIRVTI
ncbi:uncharacterized protein LOC135142846 [Zophobas morio]|uniref:uncharacterized protein LOC135142846 n=1 Tax=Zophobas morio TaxID=2755281 RepID=UPI003082CA46